LRFSPLVLKGHSFEVHSWVTPAVVVTGQLACQFSTPDRRYVDFLRTPSRPFSTRAFSFLSDGWPGPPMEGVGQRKLPFAPFPVFFFFPRFLPLFGTCYPATNSLFVVVVELVHPAFLFYPPPSCRPGGFVNISPPTRPRGFRTKIQFHGSPPPSFFPPDLLSWPRPSNTIFCEQAHMAANSVPASPSPSTNSPPGGLVTNTPLPRSLRNLPPPTGHFPPWGTTLFPFLGDSETPSVYLGFYVCLPMFFPTANAIVWPVFFPLLRKLFFGGFYP